MLKQVQHDSNNIFFLQLSCLKTACVNQINPTKNHTETCGFFCFKILRFASKLYLLLRREMDKT